jgi:hypothetical protein
MPRFLAFLVFDKDFSLCYDFFVGLLDAFRRQPNPQQTVVTDVVGIYKKTGGKVDGLFDDFHKPLIGLRGNHRLHAIESIATHAAAQGDSLTASQMQMNGAFQDNPIGYFNMRATSLAEIARQRAAAGDEAGRLRAQAISDAATLRAAELRMEREEKPRRRKR